MVAIETVQTATDVLVPREPSQKMLDAAWLELAALYHGDGGWIGKIAAIEQAKITYHAMVGATEGNARESARDAGSEINPIAFCPACEKEWPIVPDQGSVRNATDMRERCARVCDEGVKWEPNFPPNIQRVTNETCFLLAKAIRALPVLEATAKD